MMMTPSILLHIYLAVSAPADISSRLFAFSSSHVAVNCSLPVALHSRMPLAVTPPGTVYQLMS